MTETRHAYEGLRAWVEARTGLSLTPDRRASVDLVIAGAMARAGLGEDVQEYRRRLEADDDLLDDLLAELTVGETYFFREPAQFQFLRHTVLPEIRRRKEGDHVLRAWSAGCASGEEAYSLAILFLEEGVADHCRLLATDLSRAMLRKARRGLYGAWSLRGEGAEAARPYLKPQGTHYAVAEHVRRLVTWDCLNLARDVYPSPATGVWGMDLILCRNVLIYFDRETVRRVARRLYDALAAGGWLLTASTDPPLAEDAPLETVVSDQGVFYRRGPRPASRPIRRGGEPTPEAAAPAEPTPAEAPPEPRPPAMPEPWPRASGTLPSPLGADWSETALRIRALANEDVAEAERACAAATEQHPLASELHYLRAVLLVDLGRDEEAIQAARRAIYLDRSLAIVHFTLGSLLERRGDRAGAWRAYRNVRDLCRAGSAEEIVRLTDGVPAGRLAGAAEARLAQLETAREACR
ncbi:MAG TPA: CheR family methyltransferase [Isosphaeraceae bacterium]|nr:CheR family methyltransferase [Isosphaeraceae bacterium]